jgi:hypothetical protein
MPGPAVVSSFFRVPRWRNQTACPKFSHEAEDEQLREDCVDMIQLVVGSTKATLAKMPPDPWQGEGEGEGGYHASE